MLGKLLKYEFKTFLRIMLPFYMALMALSLLVGLSEGEMTPDFIRESSPLAIIWGIALVVVLTVNIIMIIQRFRDNLLKNEAYLMLTLPVTRWELLGAKALTAFVSLIISGVVLVLAMILFNTLVHWPYMLDELSELLQDTIYSIQMPEGLLIVLIALTTVFQQVCLIYTVLLASQILPRFRALAAIGAYILAGYVQMQITLGITLQVPHEAYSLPMVQGAIGIVFAGLYFWLSGWLLHHTLNLE